MEIKVVDTKDGTPMIDGEICYLNKVKKVDDEDDIKHFLNEGAEILIKKDGKFISAEEYFKEDDSEVIEKDNDINYEEVFEVDHWRKKVANVKEYEDIEIVEQLLDYAKENETDGVIEHIEEHLNDLKE